MWFKEFLLRQEELQHVCCDGNDELQRKTTDGGERRSVLGEKGVQVTSGVGLEREDGSLCTVSGRKVDCMGPDTVNGACGDYSCLFFLSKIGNTIFS